MTAKERARLQATTEAVTRFCTARAEVARWLTAMEDCEALSNKISGLDYDLPAVRVSVAGMMIGCYPPVESLKVLAEGLPADPKDLASDPG